jgi:hypothetical protein
MSTQLPWRKLEGLKLISSEEPPCLNPGWCYPKQVHRASKLSRIIMWQFNFTGVYDRGFAYCVGMGHHEKRRDDL